MTEAPMPSLRPGKFRPPDRMIASLRASTVIVVLNRSNRDHDRTMTPGGPHNSGVRIMPLCRPPAGGDGASVAPDGPLLLAQPTQTLPRPSAAAAGWQPC